MPDDATLTSEMRDRLALALPGETITVTAPRTLSVAHGGETVGELSLDNLAAECASYPEGCEEVRTHWVASICEMITNVLHPPPLTRESIRSSLHGPDWMATVPSGISRPFAGAIVEVLVVDTPNTIGTFQPEQRAELGLDDDALFALAHANMEAVFGPIALAPFESSTRVRVLSVGDSYENVRLVLHARWQPFADEAQGALLVSAPSRDLVLVADDGVPGAMDELIETANRVFATEHHPLSPQILRFTPDGWAAATDAPMLPGAPPSTAYRPSSLP